MAKEKPKPGTKPSSRPRKKGSGTSPEKTHSAQRAPKKDAPDSEATPVQARSREQAGEADQTGQSGEAGETQKKVERPWIPRKWQRRLGWLAVLLFGLGVYKATAFLFPAKPTRSRPRKQQRALEAMTPLPLDSVLPLKAPWRAAEPWPLPAPVRELPIPRPDVPRVVLLPLEPRKHGDAPTEDKLWALALDGLLRRDLHLVDGLSLLDRARTPDVSGPLSKNAAKLQARLEGMDLVLRGVVSSSHGLRQLALNILKLPGTFRLTGPRGYLPKGHVVAAMRKLLRKLVPELDGRASDEAWKRIEHYVPSENFLNYTGRALLRSRRGELDKSAEAIPLLALDQLRSLPPERAAIPLKAVTIGDPENVEGWWRTELGLPRNGSHQVGLEWLEKALKRSPHFGAARLDRSQRLLALGRLAEANKEAARAVSLMPCSAQAHANLARVYLRRNAPALAVPLAQKALTLFPDDPRRPHERLGYEELVEARLALDDSEGALAAAEAHVREAPKEARAFAMLLRTLRHAGKPAEAKKRLAQAPKGLLDKKWQAILKAEELFWSGRLGEAEKVIRQVLKEGLRAPELQALQARIQALSGCAKAAHKVLDADGVAAFRALHARAGRLWKRRPERQEAWKATLERMAERAPEDPYTLRWRITALDAEGKYFESLEWVEALHASGFQRGPKDVEREVAALTAHARFGDARKAVHFGLSGKTLFPKRKRLYARIAFEEGLFYADRLNDYARAQQKFSECLRSDQREKHQQAVAERMVRYIKLLGASGKAEEARKVPRALGGRMKRKYAHRLQAAVEQYAGEASRKKRNKGKH